MTGKKELGAMLASMIALVAATAAHAQSAASEAPEQGSAATSQTEIGDIVVTAQRRSQRLQDVPVAASVISGDFVMKQGIRDLTDLSTRLPGLKLGASTQSDFLSIRGISSGNAAGFEQAVGTFVDGVYRGRSRSARASLFDIERVEVLKGPQTTFFGNNTIAGALNITSRKPSHTFGYNANALYSPSDGEYNLEAGVTGPVTDTLSARVAAKFSGMNGYIYNSYTGEDGPHLRDFVGRISLLWEPTDTFTSNLRFDHARNRDRSTYNAELLDCPPPAPFAGPRGGCAAYINQYGLANVEDEANYRAATGPSNFRLNLSEFAWTNELMIGEHSLTALTSYFNQGARTFISAQAVPVAGLGGTVNANAYTTYEDYESFSQELRLQSPTGGFLEYMLGAYYLHGKLDMESYPATYGSTVGAAGAPVTNAATPIVGVRNMDQTENTISVFASATVNFTERLKLNLGARFTNVHKKATRSVQAGIGLYIPDRDYIRVPADVEARLLTALGFSMAPFTDPDTTYRDFMPSASLQYKLNSQITTYASYTEGFLAGGYTDTPTPQQFGAEHVKAYEIGIKGTALDRDITFNIDAFLSNYDDLQESFSFVSPIPPFLSVSTVANVAKARSKGIEFNGTYRATDWLNFNADFAYMSTRFLRYPGAPCTGAQIVQLGGTCTQDLSGRPRILSPKFAGVVGATITAPVGNDFTVGMNPQLYHSSSYFLNGSLDPQLKQRAYQKIDLRLDFGPADRHWEIAILGKNLTNKLSTTVGTTVAGSAGSVQIIPERARSIAISLTVKH
jgi:iron complex outermembrane receptor protein